MKRVFHLLGSLRLTVGLLVCCMAIVFFGTLDQVDWGVGTVQKAYFESLFCAYPISAHSWAGMGVLGPLGRFFADIGLRIPMPGGFLVGGLLLVNLVAAHFRHFRPGWRRAGIAITHAGVLLLVVSGFATAYFQKEGMTIIPEGGSADWAQDFVESEIALTDTTAAGSDRVTVVPESLIRDTASGGIYRVPGSTLEIRVHKFWANGQIILPFEAAQFPQLQPAKVDNGVATRVPIRVLEQPETFAQNAVNTQTAIVEIVASGKSLGTWLLSAPKGPPMLEKLFASQPFSYEGRNYDLALRMRRTYFRKDPAQRPFALRLNKFAHDVYPGTNLPKNFASDLTLADPREAAPRDITVSMNRPLRHDGFTFYQASFTGLEDGRFETRLQTVQNPSYLLPYIAVFLVGFGMLLHFVMMLARFFATGAKEDA